MSRPFNTFTLLGVFAEQEDGSRPVKTSCSNYPQRMAEVLCIGDPIQLEIANKIRHKHTHTHTHPFNGPFSGTTRVSWYQKGKTNLDFTEAIDSEWQWHQLDHMQVCTSLQADNHASTPPLSLLQAGWPFLPPNQQRQSTEGKMFIISSISYIVLKSKVTV